MLATPSKKGIVKTVLGAVSHIKAWRTRAVKMCKGAKGTKAWLTDMASIGVMEHINDRRVCPLHGLHFNKLTKL